MQIDHPILQFKNVSISYTPGKNAVNHVNADIKKNRITAIMGPSGCGKSTLLRAINRMHELYPDIRISGEILMDNRNILKMNPMEVRRMAGMVFQRPNPFPTMSIFDNVIAGYKLNGIRLKKKEKEEIASYKRELERLKNETASRQKKLDDQRDRIIREANEKAHAILLDAKETADETMKNFRKFGKENILVIGSYNRLNLLFFNLIGTRSPSCISNSWK